LPGGAHRAGIYKPEQKDIDLFSAGIAPVVLLVSRLSQMSDPIKGEWQ
jgi:hypothetical protein